MNTAHRIEARSPPSDSSPVLPANSISTAIRLNGNSSTGPSAGQGTLEDWSSELVNEPDFIIEHLDDGTALFHPRTGSAEHAVRSSTYRSFGFFGGLLSSSEPGHIAPTGRIRESWDILWDILETGGYRCVIKGATHARWK
jgi:hypothetical protein